MAGRSVACVHCDRDNAVNAVRLMDGVIGHRGVVFRSPAGIRRIDKDCAQGGILRHRVVVDQEFGLRDLPGRAAHECDDGVVRPGGWFGDGVPLDRGLKQR